MQLSIHEPTITAIALKSKSWLPTLQIMGYILGMCMRVCVCVYLYMCVCVRECLWVFFKSCSTKLTINLIFLRAVSDNLSKILAVFCSSSRVLRSTSVFNWTPGREPGVANHNDDATVTRPPVTSWAVTQWVCDSESSSIGSKVKANLLHFWVFQLFKSFTTFLHKIKCGNANILYALLTRATFLS